MDLTSFLTSLGTSCILFVIFMLLFNWLSTKPGNAVVYYPNRILKGMDPTVAGFGSRNPIAWIKEAMSSTEDDVISMSGVDTAVYFVFLSTSLGILVVAGIMLLPILLPVAATDNGLLKSTTTSNGTFNNLDKLSIGNVTEGSPRLWAYLLAVYWVSIAAYYLLWKAYKHVSDLRATALMSPKVVPEQFAILVRDVPPPAQGQTVKEQVDTYFKKIYPDTFYRSLIVTDNKEVDKIWQELEGYRKKLAHAEAVYAQSKTTSSPEGTRPTNKIGFLGMVGEKVDSIEFYTEKINDTIPKLEAEQKVTLKDKQLPASLIFFTTRVAATSAAQTLHARMVDEWTVMDAPEARQLIWKNFTVRFFARQIRKYLVYVLVAVTIMFYMIPIGVISAFTTLDNLVKILPFIKPIVDIKAIKTVLQAYLPQLALIVFLALLPKFLLFLSKLEGIPSESHAIRAASGKYFYFSILNVFIGVTLAGTLFETLKDLEEHPNQIVSLLANSLPGNATFFLTFVALKFFVGYGLELSRIVPLIIFHIKRKYLCKTEAELKEAWFPGDFGYGTRVPGDMLIITIVLCYSVIAPLIIPFGVAYFGIGWLVQRNQAIKVFVPSYESNGRMWPHINNRMLGALLLYQVTMFGYIGAKKKLFSLLLIPLPITTLLFAYVTSTKFYKFFQCTALEVVCRELKEVPNLERIYRSYLPPSLSSEKVEDDQFEDALSQVSRVNSAV
ncbi:unnamed protein product [Rhodiola kirilowii]